jgi:F0F1-type ATP synthase membrane subunit b/b'
MLHILNLIITLSSLISSNLAFANQNKAGLPQLDLATYPSLIFWSIISLMIGYFLMKYLVTPNIKSILNLRETNIQNDLVKAKASSQENDKVKQDILTAKENIKLKSQKLINEALTESKIKIEKSEINISIKLEAKVSQAEKKLKELQIKVITEIINSADEITQEIVQKFTNLKQDKANIKQAIKVASKNILMEK